MSLAMGLGDAWGYAGGEWAWSLSAINTGPVPSGRMGGAVSPGEGRPGGVTRFRVFRFNWVLSPF